MAELQRESVNSSGRYARPNEVEILRDYIHIFVSVPPQVSVSKLMQKLKGRTSRKMLAEFKELSKRFWGRHVWGGGYFVASSGHVTDEVIMQYD